MTTWNRKELLKDSDRLRSVPHLPNPCAVPQDHPTVVLSTKKTKLNFYSNINFALCSFFSNVSRPCMCMYPNMDTPDHPRPKNVQRGAWASLSTLYFLEVSSAIRCHHFRRGDPMPDGANGNTYHRRRHPIAPCSASSSHSSSFDPRPL